MKIISILSVYIIAFMPFLAKADSKDLFFQRLIQSKTLSCTYSKVAISNWKKEPNPEIKSDDYDVVITEINLMANKAKVSSSNGTLDALVTSGDNGITFINGFSKSANIIVTTIYTNMLPSGQFPSVVSRHLSIGLSPIVSQYYGSCKTLS